MPAPPTRGVGMAWEVCTQCKSLRPLVSIPKFSRKKTTKNLKPIYQKASIIVNGKSVRLDTFDLDTMSKKLAFEGLSGQPSGEGLLDLIDVWNDKTGLDIKENVDDFITSVRNDFCKQ